MAFVRCASGCAGRGGYIHDADLDGALADAPVFDVDSGVGHFAARWCASARLHDTPGCAVVCDSFWLFLGHAVSVCAKLSLGSRLAASLPACRRDYRVDLGGLSDLCAALGLARCQPRIAILAIFCSLL